jgi:hypothetical protein
MFVLKLSDILIVFILQTVNLPKYMYLGGQSGSCLKPYVIVEVIELIL